MMGIIVEVKTIVAPDAAGLDSLLKLAIDAGWHVYGNIVVGQHGTLYQQVVKYHTRPWIGPM